MDRCLVVSVPIKIYCLYLLFVLPLAQDIEKRV